MVPNPVLEGPPAAHLSDTHYRSDVKQVCLISELWRVFVWGPRSEDGIHCFNSLNLCLEGCLSVFIWNVMIYLPQKWKIFRHSRLSFKTMHFELILNGVCCVIVVVILCKPYLASVFFSCHLILVVAAVSTWPAAVVLVLVLGFSMLTSYKYQLYTLLVYCQVDPGNILWVHRLDVTN